MNDEDPDVIEGIKNDTLHGVVFRGPSGAYVAALLEYDIVAQGGSCMTARRNLINAMNLVIRQGQESSADMLHSVGEGREEVRELWNHEDVVTSYEDPLVDNPLARRLTCHLVPSRHVPRKAYA